MFTMLLIWKLRQGEMERRCPFHVSVELDRIPTQILSYRLLFFFKAFIFRRKYVFKEKSKTSPIYMKEVLYIECQ